jgi:hypothetical protein
MSETQNTPKQNTTPAVVFTLVPPRVRAQVGKLAAATFAKDQASKCLYIALASLSESNAQILRQNIAQWSDGATLLTADRHFDDLGKLTSHVKTQCKSRKLSVTTQPITDPRDDSPVGIKVTRQVVTPQ